MLGASIVALPAHAQPPSYLTTRKIEHVDDYHGTKVADPYRWLEDETSPETAAWVEAQNAITFPYLARIPYRQKLLDRVMQLNNYERVLRAVAQGRVLLLQQERGPAEPKRAVHPERARWRARGADRPEHVVARTAPCSSARSRRRRTRSTPFTGSRAAARTGSEYKVLELATKQARCPTRIDWAKVSNVAWHGDGFYYSRYPEPPEGQREGVDQRESPGLFPPRSARSNRRTRSSTRIPRTCSASTSLDTTEDERFAILEVSERGAGKDGNALFVRDLSRSARRSRRSCPRSRTTLSASSTMSATSSSCRPITARRTGVWC